MENFERGKNFHQLYKQKLVERILEKKERAEDKNEAGEKQEADKSDYLLLTLKLQRNPEKEKDFHDKGWTRNEAGE